MLVKNILLHDKDGSVGKSACIAGGTEFKSPAPTLKAVCSRVYACNPNVLEARDIR